MKFGLNPGNKARDYIRKVLGCMKIHTTKDLYDKYEVNRKTIQRDFAEFEEKGLVDIVGEGRGLKYTIPLRNKFPHKLIKYQSKI